MKLVFAGCAGLLLASCATPQPIIDTASQVSSMSDAMDSGVTRYVSSLNTVRQSDAQRLQDLRRDAQRSGGPTQQTLQILSLAQDDRIVKVMSGLAMPSAADPLGPDAGVAAPPALVKFDDTPLKTVTTTARDIVKPLTAREQLKVLLDFAKTVNADLQKSTNTNNGTTTQGASPPQP